MSVVLHMEPRQEPLTWRRFCQVTQQYSIAQDGDVAAEPLFQPEGPRLNLNHHEKVDRLATRSSCAQALIAIRQGLFLTFRDDPPCSVAGGEGHNLDKRGSVDARH